ncbi:hypothetical protein B0J14DRAFT_577467 [Halenospora varia]|nr:hypothetical protein B0J14DRAFT_577467 [Halenospora varia]
MGSWDCYCAICSGPLCRVRTREDYGEDQGEDGYDPNVICEEDFEWIRTLYILGYYSNPSGGGKAYISGLGTYMDQGSVSVEPPDIPNFEWTMEEYCYDAEENGVFPFHWSCFELLVRSVTGTDNADEIDKDALYNVMNGLAGDGFTNLKLDYGDPTPSICQVWNCEEGGEFFVMEPTAHLLEDALSSIIASKKFSLPSSSQELGSCVKNDPFSKLPYELVYKIACLLPPDSLATLSRASWTVNVSLRKDSRFWKECFRRLMPWFFEIQELMKRPEKVEGKDLKGMLLWADKISTPRLGLTGPLMGLANCRRIWGVCEQLAKIYQPGLPRGWNPDGTWAERCQAYRAEDVVLFEGLGQNQNQNQNT